MRKVKYAEGQASYYLVRYYKENGEEMARLKHTITGEQYPAKIKNLIYIDTKKPILSADKKLWNEPTKVVYNYPATIVFFGDGTKTVVKVSDEDKFNAQIGIQLCIIKKLTTEDEYREIKKSIFKLIGDV